MGLDFDSLVLTPCLKFFGNPYLFTPIVSAPTSEPFNNPGILAYRDTDIVMDDGSTLSTTEISLGIQLSMFAVFPAKGDGLAGPTREGSTGYWLIDKIKPDGYGGAKLILKAFQPVPLTG